MTKNDGSIPRVFISSTGEDLKAYRAKAREAALRAGVYPVMQEHWTARDHPPLAECLERVDGADALVVIVAHRHGWVPPDQPVGDGKSITRLECERAVERGTPVLAFLVDEDTDWPEQQKEAYALTEAMQAGRANAELLTEIQGRIVKLTAFKDWLSERAIRRTFAGPEELGRAIESALRAWRSELRPTRMAQASPEAAPPAGEAAPAEAPPATPRWTDVPYPGLDVFTPEQAPIFFGRGPEVDQLIRHLGDAKTRFLAVVGVSGSGKSSLVAAGLIPHLRSGVLGGAPWRDLRCKPGERGGDPFLALAYALKPTLGTTGEPERELADALRAEPDRFVQAVVALLRDGAPQSELLLVVDQFEELFTLSAKPARDAFIRWLGQAAGLPRVRVVVTLRADFYARAVAEPILASLLRRDRGTFPLDPPGSGALHEMIAGPAQAAGLELEEGLVRQVLDDAGHDPGALALVAFALHELYEKGQAAGRLTLADYEAIGGVSGAVRRRAEVTLARLQSGATRGLDALFAHVVEVNEQEVATRRRAPKTLLQQEDPFAAGGALVDALTRARLLVAGKGEGDVPTVEVAHEALLTAWPRLVDWIEQHAESLRARRDLERAAAEWQAADRPSSGLRTGPLLQRYRGAAVPRSATAQAYLSACARRVWWQRAGLGATALAGLLGLGLFWHLSQSQYPPVLAAKGLMVQIGVWPVTEPVMVTVPAGHFEMGDISGDGFAAERPVHTVHLAEPFEIGVHEVTFEQYDLFAAATGREKPGHRGWGRDQRPVINVDWNDAVAYAEWLSERAGKHYRLPSEAEWEYAARAGTMTSRFWPEIADEESDPYCTHANVFDRGNAERIKVTFGGITWEPFACEDPFPFTAPVGEFDPNDWGLHDMLGNVWEWVQDCWHDDYEGAPQDASPWEPKDPADCGARVVRGGSWGDVPLFVRSAVRGRLSPPWPGSSVWVFASPDPFDFFLYSLSLFPNRRERATLTSNCVPFRLRFHL